MLTRGASLAAGRSVRKEGRKEESHLSVRDVLLLVGVIGLQPCQNPQCVLHGMSIRAPLLTTALSCQSDNVESRRVRCEVSCDNPVSSVQSLLQITKTRLQHFSALETALRQEHTSTLPLDVNLTSSSCHRLTSHAQGALGTGGTADEYEPERVQLPKSTAGVGAGHYHSFAITEGGGLWSWG